MPGHRQGGRPRRRGDDCRPDRLRWLADCLRPEDVDETWSGQVKLLLGRPAGEASALSGAGLLFQQQDLAVRDAYQQLLGGQGRS
ncbi:hypothetical protein A6A28_33140 [Streptomyces sp. CB03578]|nr:hypothetical protein A6A28_33140 [Streptomyces sp. CB03578]